MPSPGLPVKGADVIPDGEGRQEAVPLPGDKHFLTIGGDFNGADRDMPKQDSAEDASTGSGKEVEFSKGTCIHTISLISKSECQGVFSRTTPA